jgi:hypothetical protein
MNVGVPYIGTFRRRLNIYQLLRGRSCGMNLVNSNFSLAYFLLYPELYGVHNGILSPGTVIMEKGLYGNLEVAATSPDNQPWALWLRGLKIILRIRFRTVYD